MLNPKSRSAFEKYGVDFTGNCYNCDLAAIGINKKHFDIINVCDETDIYRNENFTYEVSKNQLTISTDKNKFIFAKIDDAPVYELKILGEKISLKKKAFSKFYTQQKRLKKFKQHDCGDFEG